MSLRRNHHSGRRQFMLHILQYRNLHIYIRLASIQGLRMYQLHGNNWNIVRYLRRIQNHRIPLLHPRSHQLIRQVHRHLLLGGCVLRMRSCLHVLFQAGFRELAQHQIVCLGLQPIGALPAENRADYTLPWFHIEIGETLITAMATVDGFGVRVFVGVSLHIFLFIVKEIPARDCSLINIMIIEEELIIRPSILCPHCGIKFTPTIGNICPNCVIAKTDVTMGITKESVLTFCRFCRRYLRPPWIACERESRELLAICLRKIKGLNRVKLISAGFIWTEPHSKRIKVKLTISKEVGNLSTIEQSFIVEFIQAYTQCEDCKKEFTPHTWGAVVQVRQHVQHKKTFFLIQQLILKHGALDKVLKVQQQDDGINFYYKNTTHAQRLIDFLGGYLPLTVINSKELISHDESSNIFTYKYGFSVTIPRICKDDLVLITKKMATVLGGCCRLLLCLKVGVMINLLDLASFKVVSINAQQYQHYDKDIQLLALKSYKIKFSVLDCSQADPYKKKSQNNSKISSKEAPSPVPLYSTMPIYDAVVAQQGNWQTIHIRTHLALSIGQEVDGFDLRTLNYGEELNQFKGVQDVILVRKTKQPHRRHGFKLKRLQEQGVMIEQKPKKKKQEEKEQKQYEEFMDELADDKDALKNVKLYKNKEVLEGLGEKEAKEVLGEIDLCELLEEMKITDNEPNTYQNDMEGIEELVQKMAKVTIENKPEESPKGDK